MGWKRTRASGAKSRSRKGQLQPSHVLPLTHPQCTTRTCTHAPTHMHTCTYTHTHAYTQVHMQHACMHTCVCAQTHIHTHILIHTGYPQGALIPRPPSHIQLQTLFSASVFGLCVLFASPCDREGGFAGRDWETQDEAVSSPSARFASAHFEGEGAQ